MPWPPPVCGHILPSEIYVHDSFKPFNRSFPHPELRFG
jgi:hypothetical protein